ncbi:hypothetical protein TB1_029668 [Malus domestica]
MAVCTLSMSPSRTLAVGKPLVANAVLFFNYSMEEFCAVSIVTENMIIWLEGVCWFPLMERLLGLLL